MKISYNAKHVNNIHLVYTREILKNFFIMFIVFNCLWIAIYCISHYIGEYIVPDMNIKISLNFSGQNIAKEYFGKDKHVEDFPEAMNIIKNIIKNEDDVYKGLEVVLSHSENVFGGVFINKIIITKGMLELIESKNGLTYLLAHEIGHIVHRDTKHNLYRKIFSLPMFFWMNGKEIMVSALLYSLICDAEFIAGRFEERKADLYAVDVMNRLYGHTGGYDELLSNYNKKFSGSDDAVDNYFDEHPSDKVRLEYMKKYINEKKYQTKSVERIDYCKLYPTPEKK